MQILSLNDFLLADAGITAAPITSDSEYLGFSAERRAGVRGSVFFGGSAEPARWNAWFHCQDVAGRNALLRVIAQARSRMLYLVAQRQPYGQELVATQAAVVGIDDSRGTELDLFVTFEADDSVWVGLDRTQRSKSFTSTLDHRMALQVPGNVPTTPVIRLTADAQRTTQTANVGWKYRRRFRITNLSDAPLIRYPVLIPLGDTTPLTTAKALANGNDVRVWLDGLEQMRTLKAWDTSDSRVWVVVPQIPANGGSAIYDVVYGNPSAGTPPTLVYPEQPIIDLGQSTNASWYYRTNSDYVDETPVLTYQGMGLWHTGDPAEPYADMGVPAAWRTELTFDNPADQDDKATSRSVTDDAFDPTVRMGLMAIVRRRTRDAVSSFEEVDYRDNSDTRDAVTLYHPLGVTHLTTTISYYQFGNVKTEKEVTTTVGDTSTTETVEVLTQPTGGSLLFVVAIRDSAASGWTTPYVYATDTGNWSIGGVFEGFDTESLALNLDLGGARHVALAAWPGTVRDGVTAHTMVLGMTADTVLTIDTTNLLIEEIGSEQEIYEVATELRLGGGANAAAPYSALLVGNARSESGAGTPRVAMTLVQGLEIDADARTHTVWDEDFTEQQEVVSAHTVRAVSGFDESGDTVEYRDSTWLPLVPPLVTLPNGGFDADIASWELGNVTADMTATPSWDDTIGGDQDGALKVTIGPNTAGSGASAEMLSTRFYEVYNRESVEVAAWVRTTHANIRPLLQILWYHADADTPVAASTEASWTPTANTTYERVFAARVPAGAAPYRVCLLTPTAASSATGAALFDDVTVNGNDLYVADVALGSITVEALIRGRFV